MPFTDLRKLFPGLLLLLFFHPVLCIRALADDGKKSGDSASSGASESHPAVPASKPESGLTDRERWLLDRVDQLEKRVEELESKQPNATAGGATPSAVPTSVISPAMENVASSSSLIAPATVSPSTNSIDAGRQEQTIPTSAAGNEKPKKAEPFSYADWTWLNGNSRTKDSPLDTKYFTPEFRSDTSYIYDFAHPQDHTLTGTSESGRTDEFQVQQLGVGGDFHVGNVQGRLMTQFGMYSTMTPRNDPTVGKGQWQMDNAYRYVSEAYGGYHINALHGINIQAGIFMSYVGLFSYYNFDNWTYQPSYVSSNTPWFFNGMRVQIFPTAKLKIEPWLINGWQSYGTANSRRGLGMQVLYRPNGSVAIISNNYGVGQDTLGVPGRTRWHTDDSIEVKYYDTLTAYLINLPSP